MGANDFNDLIATIKAAQTNRLDSPLLKSFLQPASATTGLQAYDLEAPSKKLYPVLTPLRNEIPRIGGGFAIQANWKAITNINVANVRAGVGEGKRGGVISHAQSEYFAAYRGWGLENNASFEAVYAGRNYEDIRALAVQQTLEATMIQEERLILGGNTNVAMGTTPTPTVVAATSGGSLADATYKVICVALGLQAYLDVAGVNNGGVGEYLDVTTAQVPGAVSRTNADGTTSDYGGGSAQKSAASADAVISGGSGAGKLTCTVAAVKGAVGYAWFVGVSGSEKLAAVTSINSAVITVAADSGAQAASSLTAADHSTSALDFDGLLYQAAKTGSNAYWKTMANGVAGTGTPLTSDGAGGIVEFEEAFAYFFNRYRITPTTIDVSSQELLNITKKIIDNGGAPLLQLSVNATQQGMISAGVVVGSYLNKITNTRVAIRVHPNMPAGTMMFSTMRLPYPLAGIPNIVQMRMRQDYYQIEWPLQTRQHEFGVYADGVLQHYAPFSLGVITNIGNG